MTTEPLTAYQTQKIKSAIADCDRYIGREEKMGAYNRPAEIQTRLEWCKAHKAKLQGWLETGIPRAFPTGVQLA